MATNRSLLEGLIADILSSSSEAAHPQSAAGEAAVKEIKSLVQRDYARPLARCFSRCEVREIISEGRHQVWPDLNRKAVSIGPPREFIRRWSGLGVDFRLTNLSSSEGLALLGFYVKKAPASKRPLICVNTAHHEIAIGAAFSHEMGHHVTAQMFASYKEPAYSLLYTGYGEHLDDPVELAADILVSLGAFPAEIALTIFGKREKSKRAGEASRLSTKAQFAKVLGYFRRRYDLAFEASFPATKKLQYLAGVIHYARLRQALLDEYGL